MTKTKNKKAQDVIYMDINNIEFDESSEEEKEEELTTIAQLEELLNKLNKGEIPFADIKTKNGVVRCYRTAKEANKARADNIREFANKLSRGEISKKSGVYTVFFGMYCRNKKMCKMNSINIKYENNEKSIEELREFANKVESGQIGKELYAKVPFKNLTEMEFCEEYAALKPSPLYVQIERAKKAKKEPEKTLLPKDKVIGNHSIK